jgi:hypothetical protein
MAVRFKLDHAGIKLSLRQWCRFTLTDRERLLRDRCETVEEIHQYRQTLIDFIRNRAADKPRDVPVHTIPPWTEISTVPEPVRRQAHSMGMNCPDVARWAALRPLQRFALLKLTGAGHDNDNFTPAMREFGLA